jgi:phosphate-selective porin OprO and OprP
VARYSTLNLDYHADAALVADRILGGKQDITSLGLGWTLNPAMRFIIQGQDVKVDRHNSSGVQIGQDYTTVAVRSQFGF